MKYLTLPFLALLLVISCSKDEASEQEDITSTMIDHFDWIPDTLVVDSMLIDLNNDEMDDLKFLIQKIYQGTSPSSGPYYNYFARCMSLHSDLEISLGTEIDPFQQEWNCLELNDPISNDLTWGDSFILKGQVIGAGGIGIWDTNTAEGYLGVKSLFDSETRFGWIKVSATYYEITCYEYAISQDDNGVIVVGQIE